MNSAVDMGNPIYDRPAPTRITGTIQCHDVLVYNKQAEEMYVTLDFYFEQDETDTIHVAVTPLAPEVLAQCADAEADLKVQIQDITGFKVSSFQWTR